MSTWALEHYKEFYDDDECIIVSGPVCLDRDCNLNCEGRCHDVSTILISVPSTVYTCSLAVLDFVRSGMPDFYCLEVL